MIKGPFKINGNLILTLDDLQKHFDIIEILKKPKGLIRFLEETAPEKACKVKEIEFFPTYEFVDKITEALNCEQHLQSSLNAIFCFSEITDQRWMEFVDSLDPNDQRISQDFVDLTNALHKNNMTSLIFEVGEQKLPDVAWGRLVRNTSPEDIEESERERFIQIKKLITSGINSRVTVSTASDNNRPTSSNSKRETFKKENEFLEGVANLPQEIELTGQLAERVKDIFLLSAETWETLLETEKTSLDDKDSLSKLEKNLRKKNPYNFDNVSFLMHPLSLGIRYIVRELVGSNSLIESLMNFSRLHLLENYEVVSYSSDSKKKQLILRFNSNRQEKHFTTVLKECCLTCNHFRCRRKLVNKEYISYESDVGFCGDYSSSIERFDYSCYNYERWWELK